VATIRLWPTARDKNHAVQWSLPRAYLVMVRGKALS